MQDPYDLTVVKGDTLRWSTTFKDSQGATYNLSGATLTMQVRSSYYPASLVVSYQIGITSGSTLQTPNGLSGGISALANGSTANMCVGSTYTAKLSPYVVSFYDIQAARPANDVITLQRGKITVLPDVTVT